MPSLTGSRFQNHPNVDAWTNCAPSVPRERRTKWQHLPVSFSLALRLFFWELFVLLKVSSSKFASPIFDLIRRVALSGFPRRLCVVGAVYCMTMKRLPFGSPISYCSDALYQGVQFLPAWWFCLVLEGCYLMLNSCLPVELLHMSFRKKKQRINIVKKLVK